MRKLFTIVLLLLSGLVVSGQSTLPNGNFEEWIWESHPTHPAGGFYEPGGGFFKTLNILDTIPVPPGLTCYPTDSAHTGLKAARLITRKINLMDILIPGVTGTLRINWLTLNANLGTPYIWATIATRFQGYYMSFPLLGDSTGVVLLLSKWNSVTHKRDTIAYNRHIFYGTVAQYTAFDDEITYWDQVTMPDSITLLLLSCGGYNAINMMASVGQVGSTAYFDDVTLTDISGFQHLLMPELDVRINPNPARDHLNITLSEPVKNGTFSIYNTSGQFLQQHSLEGKTAVLRVDNLSAGMYYYKVTVRKDVLNTGTFVIGR
jgi:hypothetical protein